MEKFSLKTRNSKRTRRKETGNLTAEENIEYTLNEPSIEQLQSTNKKIADKILTDIQHGMVKQEQISQKKTCQRRT